MASPASDSPRAPLARFTWGTVLLSVAFALMALTAVTVALFATIDSKQKSEANAEHAFAEAQAARAESQAARAEVAALQGQSTCRAGFGQLVDLALLKGSGSLLTLLDDLSRQTEPLPVSPLSAARVAVTDAVEQRRTSNERCAVDPNAKPDYSKVDAL